MSLRALIAGDTSPERQIYRDGETKAAIDITGYTISLRIDYPTPLTKAAVLVPEVTGAFEFHWLGTDLVEGAYKARIIIINTVGEKRTHKIGIITIEP